MRQLRKLTNKEWNEIGEKYKNGGVHMYRGKLTYFYNGEKLFDRETGQYLIHDEEERKKLEVIMVLPGVKVIPEYTFSVYDNLKTVIMSDSVKRIEFRAFNLCKSLEFVRLSTNLEYIGNQAFSDCYSLTSIFIPESCTGISREAFLNCKKLIILSVTRHTTIGNHAIALTALIKVSHLELGLGPNLETIYYDNDISDEVNQWIKSRHDKFPLHKICCSENPKFNQLNQEYTSVDWMKEDDCKLTPLHYLVANSSSSVDMVWSIIKQHKSIIIGADKSKLGESLLFRLITWEYTMTDFLSILISISPADIVNAKNVDGKTMLGIFQYRQETEKVEIIMQISSVEYQNQVAALNDDPKRTPDRLGYQVFADGITSVVQQAEISDAYFCVGLFSPWGCGKSKLWTLIKQNLDRSSEVELPGFPWRFGRKKQNEYIFSEFNAWTYNGTNNLWASFMENIWSSIESEFSSIEIKMHRASIALVDEDESDDWHEKKRKRKKALHWFYIWSILSLIIAVAGISFGIWLLVSFGKFNGKFNIDNKKRVSNLSNQWIVGIFFITASPIAFFKQTLKFLRDVLPYLRRNSKEIFQAALFGDQYSRRDFSQDMGYMGEIKKEAEYLFDFLREKNISSRKVRMCLFVDDLDRCNSQTVVSVLEAVFLLLSESPITCYLAIDTRLVVASIDEHYTVHDRAGINGYDFLEKIVQLPFCIPDLSDSKKQKFMEHLFLHAHLQPSKFCGVISSLQKEGTYPQVELIDAPPEDMNDEKEAFEYLVEQFVTKLEKNKIFMTESQKVYFSKCDTSTLLKSGDSEKEPFLFMIASYVQHIQELTPEENAKENMLDEDQDERMGETNVETEGRVQNPDVEENMSDDPEESESNLDIQDEKIGVTNVEIDDLEDEEQNDNSTSTQSNDLKRIAPFASMVTPKERKWFKDFAPFMVGKARSITRVVNVYNLARYVAGRLLQNYTNDDAFKRKLMKVIILAEFWPYRTAFLMQVAEDLIQIQQIKSAHSKEDDIHLDEDHGSLCDALRLLFDEFANYSYDEMVDHIMDMSLSTLYNKMVQRLLCSPKDQKDTRKMLSRDCDPQMFECLLSDVCKEGKLEDRLKVKDLVVPSNLEHSSSCLRFLTLNMSRHMLEFTSKCLDDIVVFVDSQGLDNSKKTLRFDYKNNHYQSGAVGWIGNEGYRGNMNSILFEVKNEQGITCEVYDPQHRAIIKFNGTQKDTPNDNNEKEKKADSIFICIKEKINNKYVVKEIIKRCVDDDETVGDCLVEYIPDDCVIVHIDDDIFMWEKIKNFHIYDLPELCGKRSKYNVTFAVDD